MGETFNFDLIFVKRFAGLISRTRNQTNLVLISFLLLLSILYETAVYSVGMITGNFYKVLGDKDWNGFWYQTIKALILIICVALIKSSKQYVASTLQIELRKSLTKTIHLKYFSNLFYYKLNVTERQKDNFDQRITQDIQEFCKHFSLVLPELLVSPFIIGFYTYRSFVTIGYIGPLGCLLFFILSTIINKMLISSVLKWVYCQQRSEGDFRFEHLHVRNAAESIAFLSGQTFEYNKSDKLFNQLVSIQENLILKEFYLKSSVFLFDYLGSIVSFLVLSVPIFSGRYESYSATDLSQLISQSAFVTMYLINCFTRLIDTSADFATIGGTTHRIAEVFESLDNKQNGSQHMDFDSNQSIDDFSSNSSKNFKNKNIYLKLKNVSIAVPNSRQILIDNLDLEIRNGQNLLISGPSGSSKTSILRVIKGLWIEGSGSIKRLLPFNDPKMVLFLPQKPVMTAGSLVEQISYPLEPELNGTVGNGLIKEHIKRCMNFLDLGHILERIGDDFEKQLDWNWNDCLSPGEQQRISFVRLFYHKPVLAFLDESTSAVSFQMEQKIYEECKRLDMTLVSCGHRNSLQKYHSNVLRISKTNEESVLNQYIIESIEKNV